MNKIGLLVGEDCDLPPDILKKNDIHTFPFIVSWSTDSKNEKTYAQMRKYKESNSKDVLQTSQPSVGQFKMLYEDLLKKYDALIVLIISSGISGTFNAANQAQNLVETNLKSKITIIDSDHISVSEGMLAIEITKNIKNNKSVKEIVQIIGNLKKNLHIIGTIEDPFWLELSGRINMVKSVIIRQLIKVGIRPLLGMQQGKVELLKIKSNVPYKEDVLFNYFTDNVGSKVDNLKVAISHADDLATANRLKKKIEQKYNSVTILPITTISSVFGAHIGPGGIVLGWLYT